MYRSASIARRLLPTGRKNAQIGRATFGDSPDILCRQNAYYNHQYFNNIAYYINLFG